MCDSDVLQPIDEADIPKLRDIYKAQLPRPTYVNNYLSSVIRWKRQRPDKNYITLMAPNGNWKDGTFVALHEFWCYELFMFTLEKDCQALCEALVNTKKLNWSRKLLLYGVYDEHHPIILKALEKTAFCNHSSDNCDVWWIPKEKALNFEINCPPEVYVTKLDLSHAVTINSRWPHKYENSDKYIAKMIEINGGCGVFLKSNGKLVAWILRNLIGLGVLQTEEEYKRRGYGSLVTKVLAKEIAQEGVDPLANVIRINEISRAMFKKLGFETLESVVYTENREIERSGSHSEN